MSRASQYINLEDSERMVKMQYNLDLLDKNFENALEQLPLESSNMEDLNLLDMLQYARTYEYMRNKTSAEIYYKQALQILQVKASIWGAAKKKYSFAV